MKSDSYINKTAVLAIILISYVMIVLDISIVITGLPKIKQDLGFSDAGLSWISNAYTLTFGGFLLLGARAGDLLGRRRLFMTGLAIFAVSSLAIGLAQSPAGLVIARAVQGLGSAILAPATLALLQTHFAAGRERHRAIALYASAAGISASIGLVLGGILADWLSWRVGFFINLPVGAALIWAAKHYLPETPTQRGTFDLAGAFSSTLGMSALVFAVVHSAVAGWSNTLTLQALTLGLVLLTLFVGIEWRGQAAHHAVAPVRPSRAQRCLPGACTVSRRQCRLLLLCHPIYASGPRFQSGLDRVGISTRHVGQLPGGPRGHPTDPASWGRPRADRQHSRGSVRHALAQPDRQR